MGRGGRTFLCLIAPILSGACEKARPERVETEFAWACSEQQRREAEALRSEKPVATLLRDFSGTSLKEEAPRVAEALLAGSHWLPAIEFLEASLAERPTAQLQLIYGDALLYRARETCSVPDALWAAAQYRAASAEKSLGSLAEGKRDRTLEMLGLTEVSSSTAPMDLPAKFSATMAAALRQGDGDRRGVAEQLVDESPWLAARELERVVWPAWAEAIDRRHGESAQDIWELLGNVSNELARRGFDRMPETVYEQIRRRKSPSGEVSQRTCAALADLGRGIDAYERQHFDSANRFLREARLALEQENVDLALWARFYEAVGTSYENTDRGLREFGELSRIAEKNGYVGLAGRARWLEGTSKLLKEDLAGAMASYRAARRHLEAAGGAGAAAFIDVLEAEALSTASDYAGAWKARQKAFVAVPKFESVRRQIAMLWEAATALDLQGRPDLREPLLDRATMLADVWGEALGISTARLERARWSISRGDLATAREDIRIAEESIRAMGAGSLKTERLAALEIERGLLVGASDPVAGATVLSRAIEQERRRSNSLALLELLPMRARMFEESGSKKAALDDLIESMQLYRSVRSASQSLESRNALHSQVRRVLDAIVDLKFDSGEPEDLIPEIEEGRSFGAPGTESAAVDVAAIAAECHGCSLIYSHATEKWTYFWRLAAGEGDRRVRVPTAALARLVKEYEFLGHLRSDDSIQAVLSSLHELVLRPLGLARQTRIVVYLPDPEGLLLPFHAFYDASARQYLIEGRAIAIYPDLRSLNRDLSAAGHPSRRNTGEVLVVAVSEGGGPELPGQSRLESANEEAAVVAMRAQTSLVLAERHANRDEIVVALGRSGVVKFHFAGHAVANSADPAESFLLLSGGQRLRSADLEPSLMRKLELVVLSACSTLDPLPGAKSAAFGLAGEFYSRGAHAVVASSAELSDRAAAEFAPLLYSSRAGEPAVLAFRDAVLEAGQLGGDISSPAFWGRWHLLGGLSRAEIAEIVRQLPTGSAGD